MERRTVAPGGWASGCARGLTRCCCAAASLGTFMVRTPNSHLYLEFDADRRRAAQSRADLRTGDARQLKGIPRTFIVALQTGLRSRGAELTSYNGGMTSAAHTEEDVDQTVEMFDDLIGEMVQRDKVPLL